MRTTRAAALGLFLSALAACADSVPVDCPGGFELTSDKTDCVPVAVEVPDAGPFDDPPTCEDLDCDDGNECTVDGCADATCSHEPAEDGIACTVGDGPGLCLGGQCFPDCSKQDCRPVYPCTEEGIRDAIRDGGDVIIGCETPTTVTLTEGVLEIADQEVSLDGLGNLTIDAEQKSRVFTITGTAVVELIGMGITGGLSPPDPNVNWRSGGGVWVLSTAELTLRQCRIFGNVSIRHGGGLSSTGTTAIIDSEITDNTCANRGGGVTNGRSLTIRDSLIARNHSQGDGGGIYNTTENGRVTLERSVVKENVADDAGGGIWTSGPMLEVKDSSVIDNRAGGGAGGIRLWTSAEVHVTDSVIARNVANREGGGILNHLGVVTLERTVVSQNASLEYRGGGIYNDEDSILEVFDSVISENAAQHGGAMYQLRGTSRFVRSAIVNNVTPGYGGAFRVYQHGPGSYDLTLENSTVSGNQAGEVGGGITTRDAVVWRMAHSTLVGNEAPLGAAIQQDRETIVELASSAIHGGCDASDDSPLSSLGFNAVLDLGPETCVLSGSETDQILSDEEMSL
ncbi:MAG TPA: right-handed parallel beta-helix repeat-containing protein, partial [Polyangiales bacterium]|nr:right-handed parallel beta-helix repeat-containing protein [Polyangiales bacterium]